MLHLSFEHDANIDLPRIRSIFEDGLYLRIELIVPNHHLLMVPNILEQQITTRHVNNHRFIDNMAEVELLTKSKQFDRA